MTSNLDDPYAAMARQPGHRDTMPVSRLPPGEQVSADYQRRLSAGAAGQRDKRFARDVRSIRRLAFAAVLVLAAVLGNLTYNTVTSALRQVPSVVYQVPARGCAVIFRHC